MSATQPSGRFREHSAESSAPVEVFEFPATLAQRRFWLLDQLHPGNPALNMPLAFDLKGRLDRDALSRSLAEILRRHEALRTSFASVDGEVKQVAASSVGLPFETQDLANLPESEREVEAERQVEEEARRPFSLAEAPLFRARLIRLSDREHVLLLTLHHIVCDGWSNGILVRELGALYEAYASGRPSPLPELPIQYADYACWQREWLASARFDQSLAYWKERLSAPLVDLELPFDRPRSRRRQTGGVIESRLLPATLSRELKALGKREDATMFMLFLAAFQTLLFRYTGQPDLVLASPSANRHPAETEKLIGCFAHPLLLRTDLSGNPEFTELLERVRDVALGAFNHQALPFERLVEELRGDGNSGAAPNPRVLFIYQSAFMRPLELPELSLVPRRSVSPGAQVDLVQSVVERDEGHRLQLEYDPELFDHETIRTLLAHFQTLLESIVRDPATPVASLALWTPAEIAAIRERDEIPADDPRASARRPVPEIRDRVVSGLPAETPEFVAPRTETERRLQNLWEEVLGVRPIGVTEDYFELGGHSLSAVRLVTEIERVFGRELPLAALVQAPTIAEMAELLCRSEVRPSWSSLVPIQSAGNLPPFYCVHAVGGNVLTYLDLARHLGDEQPVYGLQALGLDGVEAPHTTLEEMAAHYVREIRKLQPEGPYHLGGTSSGGLVAFEMAQQLRAEGQEVAVLALFDTWGPGYPRWRPGLTPLRRFWNRFSARVDLHWGNFLAARGGREKLSYVFRKTGRARRRFFFMGRHYWNRLREPIQGFVHPISRTLKKVEKSTRKAAHEYVPRVYPGRVALFRATKQPAWAYPDPNLGWKDLVAGGIDIYEVPGHHGAIVYEPRIAVLAEQLKRCLAAASKQASSENSFAAPKGSAP